MEVGEKMGWENARGNVTKKGSKTQRRSWVVLKRGCREVGLGIGSLKNLVQIKTRFIGTPEDVHC